MAELVDALDLGSSGVTRESSSLSFRTRILRFHAARTVLRASFEAQESVFFHLQLIKRAAKTAGE